MNDQNGGKLNLLLAKIKLDQEKKEKIVIGFLLGVFLLLIASPVSDYSKNASRLVDGTFYARQ